jgi:predicted GIY-YIG superfamily endonuclease
VAYPAALSFARPVQYHQRCAGGLALFMTTIRSYKKGTVYLVHFENKLSHSQHYIGYAGDLFARMRTHRKGRGARLLQVLNELGINWHCVRTWRGGRKLERRLKNRKNASKLCPICKST